MFNELTIIIPVLNEEKYIPKLLDCITNQPFIGKLQVIVVDGGSYDNTISEVKKNKDKIEDLLVISTTKGVGHQRNIGAERAKYNYILFIDADTILPRNFLSKLEPIAKPS